MTLRYSTAEALNAALTAKIKLESERSRRDVAQMRREFILQRFLARLFDPDATGGLSNWILKGGTGLLLRVPGSRHTRDIDLQHLGDRATALEEIGQAASRPIDRFRFAVGTPVPMAGRNAGVQVTLTASLGAKEWGKIPIDIVVAASEPIGIVELLTPIPVIEIDDIPTGPPIRVYPLAAQIADKVCAMYERPRQVPSTRFHDLADLVTIFTRCQPAAGDTHTALTYLAALRNVELSVPFGVPGLGWQAGYSKVAKAAGLPDRYQSLTAALDLISGCLGPVLAGNVPATSLWNCANQSW